MLALQGLHVLITATPPAAKTNKGSTFSITIRLYLGFLDLNLLANVQSEEQ